MAEVLHGYKEQATLTARTSNLWGQGANTCAIIGGTDITWLGSTKYLIIAKGVMGGNSASTNAFCRLEESATLFSSTLATDSEMMIEPTYTTNGEGASYFFARSYTTVASPTSTAEIQFQLASQGTSDTAWLDQRSILVIDLDDLGSGNYVEATDAGTGQLSTSSWATVNAAIANTSLAASTEYLVLGYAGFDDADTGNSFHCRLAGDNDAGDALDQLTYHYVEGEDTAERRIVGVQGRVLTEATPAVGIEIQSYTDKANSWAEDGAYLIAIDVAAFADFDYATTLGNLAVTGTPASPTTLATISSYNPTTAGNHLVLGRFNYSPDFTEARTSGDLYVDDQQTADQSADTGTTIEVLQGPGSSANEAFGQSVTCGQTQTIYSVSWSIDHVGTPTDGLTLKIKTGSFSGTVIATSEVLDGPDPGFLHVDFLFPAGVSVTSSTVYYLVVERTGSKDVVNIYRTWHDTSSSYAGGVASLLGSGGWVDKTYDYRFFFPSIGDVDVLSGDIDTYQTQAWDPTDGETVALAARESLTTKPYDLVLRGAGHASDGDPQAQYRFVAVLNLVLASVGGETQQLTVEANVAVDTDIALRTNLALTTEANVAVDTDIALTRKRLVASSAPVATGMSTALSVAAKKLVASTSPTAVTAATELTVTRHLTSVAPTATDLDTTLNVYGRQYLESSTPVAATAAVSLRTDLALASSTNTATGLSTAITVKRGIASSAPVATAATIVATRTRLLVSVASVATDLDIDLTSSQNILLAVSMPTAVTAATAIDATFQLVFTAPVAVSHTTDVSTTAKIQLEVSMPTASSAATAIGLRRQLASTAPTSVDLSTTVTRTQQVTVTTPVATTAATALTVYKKIQLASVAPVAVSTTTATRLRASLSSFAPVSTSATIDLATTGRIYLIVSMSVAATAGVTSYRRRGLAAACTAAISQETHVTTGYVFRPDGDLLATGWETAPTPAQNLYAQIDEGAPDPADYVYSTG